MEHLGPSRRAQIAVYGYEVVRSYPHDPAAFTQGLVFRDGFLYESTGRNGRSTVRKVRLETGEILEQVMLGQQFFGEGLTDWGEPAGAADMEIQPGVRV